MLTNAASLSRDLLFWLSLLGGAALPFLLPATLLSADPPSDLFAWLSLCLLYPLLEEYLFRGVLLDFLSQRLSKQWGCLTAANLLTAGVFALLHGVRQGFFGVFAVFPPGLLFGYFRERSGGLLAPMLLHVAYNSAFFLASAVA